MEWVYIGYGGGGEMKKIKRDDAIYLEIESFADYELTQCIAYEMAVRNKQNLLQVDNVIKFYHAHKDNLIEDYFDFDKNGNPTDFHHGTLTELAEMVNSLEFIPYLDATICGVNDSMEDWEYFVHNHLYFRDKRIDKVIYEIIDNVLSIGLDHEKRGISSEEVKLSFINDDELVFLEKTDFRDGYTINSFISEPSEHALIPIDLNDEESERVVVGSVEEFINHFNSGEAECANYGTRITTNFKRPKLKLSFSYKILSHKIEIDLNRPTNEIIALIEHIKKDLDLHKNTFKIPIELLGWKVQRADNIICNKDGKCFDGREILSKQQKLTDMFFIYDCLNIGMTQRQIQNEIFNYYADKGIETKTMDAKTLKKYKEIAFDYINNGRYEELITGVKH